MKILCIGQSAYDITIPVEDFPIENRKYKINDVYECGGGSSDNSAYLLAKWHDEVYLASPIGKDDYGKRIKEELESIGVNTKYLEEKDNIKTTISYIVTNKSNGSRTIITNKSNDMLLDSNYVIDIKPDVILVDGNDFDVAKKMLLDNPKSIKIIDAGNMKDGIIELAKLCDYVVASNDFIREYTGINFDYTDLNKIYEAYDIAKNEFKGILVVTLEHLGSLTKINNEFKLVPSVKVNSIDSTGAGDIYHGAFTHFISCGYSLLDTMHYANIAGALSVTKIGSKNSMPSYEDVVNYHEL